MDLGKRLNRKNSSHQPMKLHSIPLEYGWDKEYEGIFYFMDRLGHPVQQLEWDQKLWWVHIETLITLLKGYQMTGSENLKWFDIVHRYTWEHFKDDKFGEWFGYLNRRRDPAAPERRKMERMLSCAPRPVSMLENS